MLSLLVSLSVGQLVWPPPNMPPYGFEAPLEPIRVEGAPALSLVGNDIFAVWLDRRRGLDLTDAGLDVWAGTLTSSAKALAAVLLTPQPRACHSVRLGGDMSGLTAAWACFELDGGVVETVSMQPSTASHLPALSPIREVTPGPALDLRLVASGNRLVATTRRPGSLSILQTRPTPRTQLLFGPYVSQSLDFSDDGGVTMLAVGNTGVVTAFDLLIDGGANQTQVGSDATRALGIPGRSADTFFFESAAKEVRRRLSDGGVLTLGTNTSAELLVGNVASGGVAVFVVDGGLTARVATDTGGLMGTTMSAAGTPLAIAGTAPDFMIAEAMGREVQLRSMTVMGMVTPNLSGPRAAFLAPRPQLGLAGAWSPNDNSFLVMWDQRDGGAWETREALVDTGGIFELGVVSSSARPSRPSFATAPDGGLYVALSDDVGRRLFPVIGGVLGPQVGVRDGGLLEEIVVGASSYLSWSPGTGSTRHSLGTTLSSAPPPGCVAWSQGVYLLATALGILQVSETGVTTSLNLPLPAAPLSPFQRCLTLDSRGVKYLTTWTNSDVTVHRVDALASLGQANWALAGPVASVAVHDGVVVVAALVPDGQRNTLVWSFFGGAQSVGGPLTSETQPVRNVRATATPSGDVLASWESFELDAGAWRVAMRLIQGLSPADGGVDGGGTDGGAPDGGAPDGGAPDGGTPDGGTPDGGAPDGGSADGGGTNGGAFDGGLDDAGVDAGADGGASAGPIFVPVCGCSTGDGQSLLFAGLVLLLARRARAAR